MKKLPDLSRTKAAIEAYDAFDSTFNMDGMSQDEVLAGFAKLESLGEAVGVAFGLDTADRNSMSAAKAIRPGHKVPAVGAELSFVRRMVAKWEADNEQN
jgi:hypothetical protein